MISGKKISIGIDGGGFSLENHIHSGIQRLIHEFICEYYRQNLPSPLDYYFFSHSEKVAREDTEGPLTTHQLPHRFFSSIQLPAALLKNKNKIFLGFSGIIPPLARYTPAKKVLFIHDFGFYKYPQFYHNASGMQNNLEKSVKQADIIVTFSEYIKKEIQEVFPTFPSNKIHRIYAGINHLAPLRIKTKHAATINTPYFLYVGVVKPVKNIVGLLKLFTEYRQQSRDTKTKLVIIGSKEINYWQDVTNTDTYKKISSHVIFLEDITDSDLTIFYTRAIGMINISLEEGFCYPVLEALSCGTPVITNNLPLYTEFKQHFARLYITKTLKEQISLMKRFTTVPFQRKSNIPALFTWKHFTLSLYNLLEKL